MTHLGMFESETPPNLGNASRHDKSPSSYIRRQARLTIKAVTSSTAISAWLAKTSTAPASRVAPEAVDLVFQRWW
jgi:hypothetical protein